MLAGQRACVSVAACWSCSMNTGGSDDVGASACVIIRIRGCGQLRKCVCVSLCVCVAERETVCVCACVCVSEREWC